MYAFTVIECPQSCGAKFSDSDIANRHSQEAHHQGGCRVKCYYLVRHIKPNKTSLYPTTRQIVYHGQSEDEVENHLERMQKTVKMPPGCTYSIEHF